VIALAKPSTAPITAANGAHFLKPPIPIPPDRFSRLRAHPLCAGHY
jgi:hypothetical protein